MAKYVLPIIGGYLVVYYSYWFRYRLARSEGHRFYFHIVYLGILLCIASALFVLLFETIAAHYKVLVNPREFSLAPAFRSFGDIEFWAADRQSKIFLLSLALGWLTPKILNRFPFANQYASLCHAIENRDFDLLIKQSVEENKPVLYTMSTNHVYLGFNVRGPNPESQHRWIRILPLASGYRDSETKELNFTTFYGKILNDVWEFNSLDEEDNETPAQFPNTNLEDFEVVLSTNQIHSAHLFDVNVYKYFDPEQASNF